MDLVRLGLERGASAEEAVDVIAALVREHGQGGRAGYAQARFRYHNSFLVADRREAWVLECVGRESARERVTAGVRAISNALTLPALRPHARRLHGLVAAAAAQRSRVECLAAGVASAQQAAAVLADHGPGGTPRFSRLNGAMHAPCMHAGGWLAASQTTASWVGELSAGGDRHWATGTAAPCLSVFRPVDIARTRDTGRPQGCPDAHSLWWRFERLHRRAMRDPAALPAAFHADRERTQQAVFADPARGWEHAEDWLGRWEPLAGSAGPDTRPRWLQRYWRRVDAQASRGTLLPWRDGA
jgi:hypothetical protein